MSRRLIIAAHVITMDGPPLRNAGIVTDAGKIVALGPAKSLIAEHPDAQRVDLPASALLPGFVNAHCHLDLTGLSRPRPGGSFVDWVLQLLPRAAGRDAGTIEQAVEEALIQCVQFGVTTVADITALPAITRPIAAASPVRVVSFGEVRAMATRRALLNERLAAASHPTRGVRIGVSPHAPYSVEPAGYRACIASGLPLTTHLAETPDEADFLASHAGPLRRIWEAIGGWDNAVPTFAGGPIRFAKSLGLLDRFALLAHVNYCDDDELALLAGGRASVVYCPRTHAYFGHPPHPWREMQQRGVRVSLGTDSAASSPDLNLLDDLRLLHTIAPGVLAHDLFPLITTEPAAALGMGDIVGRLAVGMAADVVGFDVGEEADPLLAILHQAIEPTHVWIAGLQCKPAKDR